MITIRRATPEDVLHLPPIELAAMALFEAIPATASLPLYLTEIEEFQDAQRQGLLWVAEDAPGVLVGFAVTEWIDGALHLEEIDVLPDRGRQGIGTRLVRALCDWARERGVASVTLCTFRDIPWNAPFYERLGFRVLREEEISPGLAERIREEEQAGLPRESRVAMRVELIGSGGELASTGEELGKQLLRSVRDMKADVRGRVHTPMPDERNRKGA